MAERGLSDFISEATEILESLGSELLGLDEGRGRDPAPETLNAVFRAAHSLKGLSALFGQDHLAALAHAMEDLLDQLRLGRVPLVDAALDTLLDALDVLNALLASLARGERSEALEARAAAVSERLQGGGVPERTEAEPGDPLDRLELDPRVRPVLTAYEEHRLRESVRRGTPLVRIRAVFGLTDFDTRLGALNARLQPVGELISTLPSSEPGEGATIAFELLVALRRTEDALRKALEGEELHLSPLPVRPAEAGARRVTPAPAPAAPTVPAAPRPLALLQTRPGVPTLVPGGEDDEDVFAASGGRTPLMDLATRQGELTLRSLARTVRVDIGRLDALMHLVGELLVTRSNLSRISESARNAALPATSIWAQELTRENRQLERRLGALQKGLLAARMVPLAQVFDRLARLVRRAAREAGKELDFAVHGGEVELDKLIVEELSDPLMHIIRNAIDHGIESPSVRQAAGKPRRGQLHLRAQPRGNHVVLEVVDDGAGMDPVRIREVAVSRGLIGPERSEELSRRELLNLVFVPGFSTATGITTLSGRGVGLDVVKTNLAHLSGIIDLWSEPGGGTRFTLTLPTTLAILRALVVGVSGRTYAVPLNSVIEILAIEDSQLATVEHREVLTVRGQTVPFARLSRLLGLPAAPVPRPFAILVGIAQERLAIAVDTLDGQRDIVTQSLPPRLQGHPGLAGATDLGDRRTVLVLDVGALVEQALRPPARKHASR